MTTPNATVDSKTKSVWGAVANIAMVVLLFALGPVMIGVGTHLTNAERADKDR